MVEGNFYCNWDLIKTAYREKRLLVYVDGSTGSPLAFLWENSFDSQIIAVRYEYRGQCIGRKLVERCIELAKKQGLCLLKVECKPRVSKGFWLKMGFKYFDEKNNQLYAYKILDKKLSYAEIGRVIDVAIKVYDRSFDWNKSQLPKEVFEVEGALVSDGFVYLLRRVVIVGYHDVVIEIIVDGKCIYQGKAKYDKAEALGLQGCRHGYYLDTINDVVEEG